VHVACGTGCKACAYPTLGDSGFQLLEVVHKLSSYTMFVILLYFLSGGCQDKNSGSEARFSIRSREYVSFLNYELKISVYYDKILQLVSKHRSEMMSL
jgi:hypothetical protein